MVLPLSTLAAFNAVEPGPPSFTCVPLYASPYIAGTLRQPTQLASYTVDKFGHFHPNNHGRRFFVAPAASKQNLGDSATYRAFQQQPKEVFKQLGIRRRLDHVLRALLSSRKTGLGRVDIVTLRRVLYQIMDGTAMELNMSFIDGVLYLEEVWQDRSEIPPDRDSFTGYAFETLCTVEPDSEIPTTTRLGEQSPSWFTVIQRTLGDLNIVFSAEIDCVQRQALTNSPLDYVELKTNRMERSTTTPPPLRSSVVLQSLVTGTPEIFVGYRDPRHIHWNTESYKINSIAGPGASLAGEVHYGYRVLKTLHRYARMQGRGPETVWRVEVGPGFLDTVSVRRLSAEEIRQVNRDAGDAVGVQRKGIVDEKYLVKMRRARSES